MIYYSQKGIRINGFVEDTFCIAKHENLNGIDTNSFTGDEIFYEIDNTCVKLYDALTKTIFDINQYYALRPLEPIWYSECGIDSESGSSKDFFDRCVQASVNEIEQTDEIGKILASSSSIFHPVSRYIYLYDLHALLGYIQNNIISIKQNVEDFYILLGEYTDVNMPYIDTAEDNYYFTSGGKCVKLFNSLSAIIITMNSVFDLISKLTFEVGNIPDSFGNKVHKFKCNNTTFVYGRNDRIFGDMNIEGTIFETDKNIKLVTELRNELIHNSSWQSINKLYVHYKQNEIVEKYILIPDFDETGTIIRSGNRNHFFAQENRINEMLPEILEDIMKRIHKTLCNIMSNVDKRDKSVNIG
jgi:hypothetical protein